MTEEQPRYRRKSFFARVPTDPLGDYNENRALHQRQISKIQTKDAGGKCF